MKQAIPRLKKHAASSVRFTHQCILLEHYTVPSNVNPPLLPTKALTADESQLLSAAVIFGQQRDVAWLSQVLGNDRPVEWSGFTAQQDRLVAGSAQNHNTLVVFGPKIDSASAHPDTVTTTLVNLERALNRFGMQYTYITVDLQLYQAACLVQWNDSRRWINVTLHPGMMHILMIEFAVLYRNTDEGIWRGHSHQRTFCWQHQHSQRKWLDQWSTGIPSHHCRVAAEFLLEWRQDT